MAQSPNRRHRVLGMSSSFISPDLEAIGSASRFFPFPPMQALTGGQCWERESEESPWDKRILSSCCNGPAVNPLGLAHHKQQIRHSSFPRNPFPSPLAYFLRSKGLDLAVPNWSSVIARLPKLGSAAGHFWASVWETRIGGWKSRFIQNARILGRWQTTDSKTTFVISRTARRL